MSRILPLHDRIVVRPKPAQQTTSGGIIIPDTAQEKPVEGTVLAVGPGKPDEPTTVRVDDVVLYGKYAGTEVNFDGESCLIMRESDIFGVVTMEEVPA